MKQLRQWWQQVGNYLASEKKSMFLALGAMLLVVLAFMAYLKFVGLPMTRAHNLYNEGMLLLIAGNKPAAHEKFSASLGYWETPETREKFNITTDNN